MKKQREYKDAFDARYEKPVDEAMIEEAPMVEAVPEIPAVDAPMMDEPAATDETPTEPAAEAIDMTGEEMTPDETQREKSWEGRLRKREEDLAAREAGGEQPAPGEALAKLSEQFGQEFADLIVQVIRENMAPSSEGETEALRSDIDDVIAVLKNERIGRHKEAIMSAHADAYEIADTPEFKEWCGTQDDPADCERIIESGTAKEVIALLTKFKAHLNSGEEGTGDEDDEAATAVRGSSPITLPNRPVMNPEDEYKAAWNAR